MPYLNSISIIGNLGRDVKFGKSQATGMSKATMSVACSRRYKDNNGETKEQTTWFPVVAFGKLADTIDKLQLKKGTCVYVGGEMRFRTYEKDDGTKESVAELLASSLQVLTPRAQQAMEQAQQERAESSEEDLPF